jgi:ribosomal protein S18 acetylase RimI-like enzyme
LWTLEESPNKILCDSLSEKDATYVNEHWNYRSERSIDYITWCLRTFPSSVIYEQNKPVGWSFCYTQSPYHINMGGLIVLPEFRRKGYGQQITIDLSTKVFQCDRKPILHVNRTNHASQLLLKGLNFVQREEMVFGKILPV